MPPERGLGGAADREGQGRLMAHHRVAATTAGSKLAYARTVLRWRWLHRPDRVDPLAEPGDVAGPGGEPRFGYGFDGRTLWSRGDRDAEMVRQVLRAAGLAQFDSSGETFAPNTFAVETGEQGAPFTVVCLGDGLGNAAQTVAQCSRALAAAGYRVAPYPGDGQVLLVEPPWRR